MRTESPTEKITGSVIRGRQLSKHGGTMKLWWSLPYWVKLVPFLIHWCWLLSIQLDPRAFELLPFIRSRRKMVEWGGGRRSWWCEGNYITTLSLPPFYTIPTLSLSQPTYPHRNLYTITAPSNTPTPSVLPLLEPILNPGTTTSTTATTNTATTFPYHKNYPYDRLT